MPISRRARRYPRRRRAADAQPDQDALRRLFQSLPEGTVILAEELTPADTALMDPRRIAGFATVLGGAESHTAIMARALDLPAVLGVAGLLEQVESGDQVIIDGSEGTVILHPTPATILRYEAQRDAHQRAERPLHRLRRLPAVTRDGAEMVLQANLELPRELEQALDAGAGGIGLLRTEFLYMNREDLPDEDEQYEALPASCAAWRASRSRSAPSISAATSWPRRWPGSRRMRQSGDGAARDPLSLKERQLLDAQLAAMLRAAAMGRCASFCR